MSDCIDELEALFLEMEEKRRSHPHYYRIRDCYYRWHRRITDFPGRVRLAYQRVHRGWDISALWGLDHHLSKTLGEQLVEMAEIAHGCPGNYGPYDCTPENPNHQQDFEKAFAAWTSDLRKHGEALQAYARYWEYDLDRRDDLYAPAQEALHWVAENLGALWD